MGTLRENEGNIWRHMENNGTNMDTYGHLWENCGANFEKLWENDPFMILSKTWHVFMEC
jgi:hypothetical protein